MTLPVGKQQLRGHDHHSGNPTTSSQALCDLVGTKPEERYRVQDLFTRMPEQVQALTVAPTNRETTIPPHLFRVILLRRLRQALSLSVRNCRCGRPLDFCGHHRAACARAGVLGRRGFALESVAAWICREAGGRVRTNMLVRDMDLDVPILEVVVDGLPLQEVAQLAVDTMLVCALHADGRPRLGAAKHDVVALKVARRKKSTIYPELVGPHSRAKLVVLAAEVEGRWSRRPECS